ncbi:TonB-dependent receptor domain-containing protein [uncultured Draconibacterium sp.]|uniref:TonB-dependent receptor plug domain-containing protein n=1 Tax=uncultured Draconibacterium sp. TaxID=1573823 RepID=UPI0029C641A2|nr:TonB-dependent receptor [uncultured Draconibacterium sp.]
MKNLQLLFILLLFTFTVQAQSVHLDYKNQSLDNVLLDFRDDYGIKLSFSNNQLSKYKITINKDFSNAKEALDFLLLNKPLTLQKIGDVYIISQQLAPPPKQYTLSATVFDQISGERLPYAHLLVNNRQLTSGQNGSFSASSKTDSLFHIQVKYLGFSVFDTTLTASGHYKLGLQPLVYELDEIEVNSMLATHKSGAGDLPGTIRLNSFVSNYLPGNGDHSVFNLLRLQPGILAAGEQSADLLIWGSYEGQSKLLFDGITLFSMKNYNDNISTINPLMVKDLKVQKGGYGVDYTGRVGSIVDVTGKDGNRYKPSAVLNINNQTINAMASVPVIKNKASLMVAMRQTYYQLYDKSSVTFGTGRNGNSNIDRTLYPDYNLRDFNVKFSGELDPSTTYKINYLRSKDDFIYSLNLDGTQSNFIYDDSEHNRQFGWSAEINHSWQNGMKSLFRISGSDLNKNVDNQQQIGGGSGSGGPNGSRRPGEYQTTLNDQINNQIKELDLVLENQVQITPAHNLKTVVGIKHQQTAYSEDSLNINLHQIDNEHTVLNARVADSWSVTPKLKVNLGLLFEHVLDYNQNYWQPRLSLKYQLSDNLNASLAYGKYTQFVTQLPQIDDFDNIRYFWMTVNAPNNRIYAQKATHKVAGLNYHLNGFKVDVNVFQRDITGLTRFNDYSYNSAIYSGESNSKGVDVLVSQTFKHLNYWLAYTYSKTKEHFDYFATDDFQRALHDQRHELKAALIYQLNKWHFSANFVYGSGFPDLLDESILNDYQRLDIALNRSFSYKMLDFNAGFSILNILNRQNIKYDNFYRLEDEEGEITLHANAVPFTPTLYFNISF